MPDKSLTILGGGIAGLSAAWYASKREVPVAVYEKSSAPGGLCRTFRSGEHLYDAGAHRFHDLDTEITADVQNLLSNKMLSVEAPSKIYDRGRFVAFPPTPMSLMMSTELKDVGSVLKDLFHARMKKLPEDNFANFTRNRFGRTFAERYLVHYSEKLWGLPADALSADVATRRLSGMSLRSLVYELLVPRHRGRHIEGDFLYPVEGCGRIGEAIVAGLPEDAVHLHREVTGLVVKDGRLTRVDFSDAPSLDLDGTRVVSTLPLTQLARLLGDALPRRARRAAKGLEFRSLRLLFVRLSTDRVTDNATIYFPDRSMCVTRVHEPKNRSRHMAPEHETALVVEVPCFDDDDICRTSPDELGEKVLDELSATGLISGSQVSDVEHRFMPSAYPVYAVGYQHRVSAVLRALENIENLDVLGRGGLFFYSHLHDQFRRGKDYVRQTYGDRL